ncbi:MAG: permease [Alkalispirochaeta sp.]
MTIKSWIPVLVLGGLIAPLLVAVPGAREPFARTAADYTFEMVAILPAVMVLMGLMTVFVSNEFIGRVLGHTSGIWGMVVAFILGTLPTGPLYVAFPFARTLRDKGARTVNIVIFLSAWACIKLPQELVELRFLGWRFMVTRLVLSVVFVTLMAIVIDRERRTMRD